MEANERKQYFNDICLINYTKRHRCVRKNPLSPPLKVIVSEGDSWFQFPSILGVTDIISNLINKRYAVYSLGAADDTLENMYNNGEYIEPIQEYNADTFLISAGGNDLLKDVGKFFSEKEIDPQKTNAILENKIGKYYNKIFDSVLEIQEAPELNIICHGYDYIIPQNLGENSVGYGLEKQGVAKADWKNITDFLIDLFNDKLSSITNKFNDRVHYVNLREKVGNKNWYDEIHPNDVGFSNITEVIIKKIEDLRS